MSESEKIKDLQKKFMPDIPPADVDRLRDILTHYEYLDHALKLLSPDTRGKLSSFELIPPKYKNSGSALDVDLHVIALREYLEFITT